MTGPTPGHAAYETFRRLFPGEDWGPWELIGGTDEENQPGWERIAQAAVDAASVPSLILKFDGKLTEEQVTEIRAALDRAVKPKPAPELAMLRADLADAEAQLARWPKCPAGCGCRIGTEDADARECGCDGPCTGPPP